MSWVSTGTRQCKRDAEPSLLGGSQRLVGGGAEGRGGRGQGVSLLFLLAHRMAASAWNEWRVKKKLIVAV